MDGRCHITEKTYVAFLCICMCMHGTHRRSGRPLWHSTHPVGSSTASTHRQGTRSSPSTGGTQQSLHDRGTLYTCTYVCMSTWEGLACQTGHCPCVSHPSSGRHSSMDAPSGDRLASDTGMSIVVTIACSW